MISVVSLAADSNRHFFKASVAAFTRRGLPPTPFVAVTRPSGEMVASIFTLPVTFICFARAGYSGTVLLFTFRLMLSTTDSCERAFGARIAEVPRSRSSPNPIDRIPSFMLTPSAQGKLRQWKMQLKCHEGRVLRGGAETANLSHN